MNEQGDAELVCKVLDRYYTYEQAIEHRKLFDQAIKRYEQMMERMKVQREADNG